LSKTDDLRFISVTSKFSTLGSCAHRQDPAQTSGSRWWEIHERITLLSSEFAFGFSDRSLLLNSIRKIKYIMNPNHLGGNILSASARKHLQLSYYEFKPFPYLRTCNWSHHCAPHFGSLAQLHPFRRFCEVRLADVITDHAREATPSPD
jgi:hypothetical protein